MKPDVWLRRNAIVQVHARIVFLFLLLFQKRILIKLKHKWLQFNKSRGPADPCNLIFLLISFKLLIFLYHNNVPSSIT